MKDFFRENAVTVLEEASLKAKLTDPQTGIFTPDTYWNRCAGRTKLSKAERVVCETALQQVRQEALMEVAANPRPVDELDDIK